MQAYQNHGGNTHIFQKRLFRTFLSHSFVNKPLVETIYKWLNDDAKIKTWYDSINLPISRNIEHELATQIPRCQSLIIFLSNDSINSDWVKFEIQLALEQQRKYRQFNIIPIRLDDCTVPSPLNTLRWLDLKSQKFTVQTAFEILRGLYYDSEFPDVERVSDIYIARGWKVDDPEADYICRLLDQAGFRLIGDDEDQDAFDPQRIEEIISGCGGLVAILPHRGGGRTSRYTLEEIKIASKLTLPYVIVTSSDVQIEDKLRQEALAFVVHDEANPDTESPELATAIDDLRNQYHDPKRQYYMFLARDPSDTAMNNTLKDLAQIVTAMPCKTGQDIRHGRKQERTRELIRNSHYFVADVSTASLDAFTEAAIAEGARTKIDMLANAPKRLF